MSRSGNSPVSNLSEVQLNHHFFQTLTWLALFRSFGYGELNLSFKCVPFFGPTGTLWSSRDLKLVAELSERAIKPRKSYVWLLGVVGAPRVDWCIQSSMRSGIMHWCAKTCIRQITAGFSNRRMISLGNNVLSARHRHPTTAGPWLFNSLDGYSGSSSEVI